MTQPTASVIVAVLDEEPHIDAVMASLTAQDYKSLTEIVVADGGSEDGTRERLAVWEHRDPRVRVIENPNRRQAHGLNTAASVAGGDYLVRADGHTLYQSDYVRRSIEVAVETGGAAGGPMNPVGETPFEQAVAKVMKTRWLMPARFHHATRRTEVDTVYLGAFRRADFAAIGGFRDLPSGAGEDPDFYFRWRDSGRKAYVDPSIRSRYRPRSDLASLWRQYLRYGRAKAEMLWANRRLPSWRPVAPLVLVTGLLIAAVGSIAVRSPLPVLLVWVAWIAFLAGVATSRGAFARFILVAATMQVAYGIGMAVGLLRPGTARALRAPAQAR